MHRSPCTSTTHVAITLLAISVIATSSLVLAREAGDPIRVTWMEGDVGGMTEFAAGNKSVLVRWEDGVQNSYGLRLDDLVKDGDISANINLLPGDIVIIPESWF